MYSLRIEDLLIGKQYYSHSRHFQGEIITAEVRDEYENTYLVYVRENDYPRYHYATVKVEVN
jgi:hypothetical protein